MVRLHGWTGYVVMGLAADKLIRVSSGFDGWNLTGATFNGSPVNYYSGSGDPLATNAYLLRGLAVKPDGTKMYVLDVTTGTVHQYTLTSAWDITSASYANKTFSVTSQVTVPEEIRFKPDGTVMYVLDIYAVVYQYNLSTAWDVSTASYASKSYSASAQISNPADGLDFKSDGTKMYITDNYYGLGIADVYEYTLSTAWDVSTASYSGNSLDVSSQTISIVAIAFGDSGSKLYVASSNDVYQYNLSSAWNLSTASYSGNFFNNDQDTGTYGIAFKSDGTKMLANSYRLSWYPMSQCTLSSAWDISSASFTWPASYYYIVGTTISYGILFGLAFSPNGTKMYVLAGNDEVYEFTLSSAWQVSTASYSTNNFDFGSQDGNPYGIAFKSDGTKMYMVGDSNNAVYEYNLSSAWDVSTASYSTNNFSINSQVLTPRGMFFRSDGTKFYVLDDTTDSVYEYDLGTAWDITSASYSTNSFSVASQDTGPRSLFFKSDGTAMYVAGVGSYSVHEYSLSTPWDVSTASHVLTFMSNEPNKLYAGGIVFNPDDGGSMYILGSAYVTSSYQRQAGVWQYDSR